MKRIQFTSDGLTLKGRLLYPKEKKGNLPAILLIHGWASNQRKDVEYSKSLVEMGYVCMTFDLGGHGESSGDKIKVSRREYVKETIDAYDYLTSLNWIDNRNIHIVGSSFGCYLAAILSGKRKVKSLLLRAPQNYPDEKYSEPKVLLQGDKLKKWRKSPLTSRASKSLRSINKFKGKIMIIQSEVDEYVPKQTYKNFINAVPKGSLTYLFMKDFHHSITSKEEKKRYKEVLRGWFSKNLFSKQLRSRIVLDES
jgi:uncharacterized protein